MLTLDNAIFIHYRATKKKASQCFTHSELIRSLQLDAA
jgi:hypothetical protein